MKSFSKGLGMNYSLPREKDFYFGFSHLELTGSRSVEIISVR